LLGRRVTTKKLSAEYFWFGPGRTCDKTLADIYTLLCGFREVKILSASKKQFQKDSKTKPSYLATHFFSPNQNTFSGFKINHLASCLIMDFYQS
jgi:hypothetical protein